MSQIAFVGLVFHWLGLGVFSGVLFASDVSATTHASQLDHAAALFEKRAEGAVGLAADGQRIAEIQKILNEVIKDPQFEERAGYYLMKINYFRATFTGMSSDGQEVVFSESKSQGERLIAKYPQSIDLRYWYIISLGKWAEVHGKLAAAQEGVADTLKSQCEHIIKVAPAYDEGGAFRILGRVHHQAPRIPFILTWPSNDEAERLLRQSLTYNPEHIASNFFLAEVLIDNGGSDQEIKQLLEKAASSKPHPGRLLEDLSDQRQAQSLLKKLAAN